MLKMNDLNKNSNFEVLGLVDDIQIRTAQNGNKYLSLKVQDSTGALNAKIWDADKFLDSIKVGSVYKFSGFTNQNKNSIQLKITNFVNMDSSDVKLVDFLISAPIDVELEYQKIVKIVDNFSNINYQKLLKFIILKYKDQFIKWPAATKFHHNVLGGLLWHTSLMLKSAIALSKVYNYAKINFDLLYSGIILHDMGKIFELEKNQFLFKYSLEGNLLGHISIMNSKVDTICKEIGLKINDDLIYLKHLILASHGKLEFGSPILPHIIEAEILSLLDNLDARIFSINKQYEKVPCNHMTNKVFSLENRWFYNHYNKKNNIN